MSGMLFGMAMADLGSLLFHDMPHWWEFTVEIIGSVICLPLGKKT